MPNTTITTSTGAISLTGIQPPLLLNRGAVTCKAFPSDILFVRSTFSDLWSSTSSPVVPMQWPQGFNWRPRVWSQRYHITGLFWDASNAGISRNVYAADEALGFRAADPVVSDASGNFTVYFQTQNPVILIGVPSGGDNQNAARLDRVVPM